MIFSVTVLIWVLGYFPNGAGNLDNSFFGIMGKVIEPICSFIGYSVLAYVAAWHTYMIAV